MLGEALFWFRSFCFFCIPTDSLFRLRSMYQSSDALEGYCGNTVYSIYCNNVCLATLVFFILRNDKLLVFRSGCQRGTRSKAWYGKERNGMENGMEWNGNFGMEYGRCQNGMEWKTIFRTSIPIPYWILCIVFTEKYVPMSGSDNDIVTEVLNLIYAYYLSTNHSTLVVNIAQTVYVLHHCKYIAI